MTPAMPSVTSKTEVSPIERLQSAKEAAALHVQSLIDFTKYPNVREFSSLTSLMKLQPSQANESEKKKEFANIISSAVAVSVVGNEALAKLWGTGVLQMEIKFLTDCNSSERDPRHIFFNQNDAIKISLEKFGIVSEDFADEIKQKIKNEINPYWIGIACTTLGMNPRVKYNVIDRIYLIVSDCKRKIHLSQNGEILKEESSYSAYVHQGSSLNTVQSILQNTELMHVQIKPDRSKIEKIADQLFNSAYTWTAFNNLVNQVQSHQVKGRIWLRLVFNFEESSSMQIRKEGTYFSDNISALTLVEITELFQIIKTEQYLGKLPTCLYPALEDCGMCMDYCFNNEGSGIKNEFEPVIADYLIQE